MRGVKNRTIGRRTGDSCTVHDGGLSVSKIFKRDWIGIGSTLAGGLKTEKKGKKTDYLRL